MSGRVRKDLGAVLLAPRIAVPAVVTVLLLAAIVWFLR